MQGRGLPFSCRRRNSGFAIVPSEATKFTVVLQDDVCTRHSILSGLVKVLSRSCVSCYKRDGIYLRLGRLVASSLSSGLYEVRSSRQRLYSSNMLALSILSLVAVAIASPIRSAQDYATALRHVARRK